MTPELESQLTFRRELARKSIHLLTVAFPLMYAVGLSQRYLVLVLGVGCLIAIATEVARVRSESVANAFGRITGSMLRTHEHHATVGATWLLLAFLLLVVTTPRDIAIAGMWAVSVGDTAAALVGRGIRGTGVRDVSANPKTLRGTAACFAGTLLGACIVARLKLYEALIAACAAALAERVAGPLDDNIRVAVGVAVAILLWRLAFS